jgi:hypothetical protein
MADHSARPGLDHLRRQARDLLRAARAGDTTAAGRIRAVADALTLASAQLAVAREYGFASRTRLRYEVAARTASLARQAEAFCEASIRDGTGRAARMLAATPEPARYSFAVALLTSASCAGSARAGASRPGGLAAALRPTLTSRKTTATSPPASSPMGSQSLRAGRSRSE